MTTATSRFYACAGSAIEVIGPPAVLAEMARDTEPFFDPPVDAPAPVLRLVIELSAPGPALATSLQRPGTPVAVDSSLYPHLKSAGTWWGGPDEWWVRIEATGSVFAFARAEGATLFQPEAGLAIRDAVRLVKSVLTVAAENRGAVQLHASAVDTERGAVVLIGDMWQGKTTLLLELLAEFEADQVSCDTVVVRAHAGGVELSGWPSPFSVSHGTLVEHAQLAARLPPERQGVPYDTLWREGKKVVLTSREVVAAFDARLVPRSTSIAACVLVEFAPASPTRLERMTDPRELTAAMRRMYLGSRDPIYHNWHRWLTAGDELIERNIVANAAELYERAPVYRMVWAPGPRSLLKRVPALARAHPVLRAHRLYEPE